MLQKREKFILLSRPANLCFNESSNEAHVNVVEESTWKKEWKLLKADLKIQRFKWFTSLRPILQALMNSHEILKDLKLSSNAPWSDNGLTLSYRGKWLKKVHENKNNNIRHLQNLTWLAWEIVNRISLDNKWIPFWFHTNLPILQFS